MSTLTGSTISTTYQSLLKIDGNNTLSATIRNISDGVGNITPLSMSTTLLNISTAFKLSSYGTGTRTGTATYNLAVDSVGNVIEVAGGGGITINPSDWAVPVRYNSNTFIDSGINIDQMNGGVSFSQLNSDLGTNIISIGDVTGNYSSLFFSVDRANEIIYTQKQSVNKGIQLDFANELYSFGDFAATNNGTSLIIDDDNKYIQTYGNGNQIGLRLDFNSNNYLFGDFNNLTNGTSLTIDNNNSLIRTYISGNVTGLELNFGNKNYYFGDFNSYFNETFIQINDANEEITFSANTRLIFSGSNLQDNSNRSYSDKNLVVQAPDGNTYYIPLYN